MDHAYRYNFTDRPKEGYTTVPFDPKRGAALFSSARGFGFVEATCATPPRAVHTAAITSDGTGFYIREAEFEAEPGFENDNYNRYGMAFRIQAPPGAYEITVKLASDPADSTVSVSGMQGSKISAGGFWDAAGLVPIRHLARTEGRTWTYEYANGRGFIDIELEPNRTGILVGVEEIALQPIPPKQRSQGVLPTIFTLGDSTVKSYTFEEAPMSGWGQLFDDRFDLTKVNVVNYSMGGRSFKNSYNEGRFNDLLMSGCEGDIVLIQFGHNDESLDENRRYGRGALEPTYDSYIREVYIPAVRARGMVPVLVTPVSRIHAYAEEGHVYTNSFQKRRFPDIMKAAARELGVTLIDLNAESVKYYNEIGAMATTSVFMSIEAGETPGKTNDGSYANGHPARKNDGTHYKEALSKQLTRLVVTEIARRAAEGDPVAARMESCFKEEVRSAITSNDWSGIFPEVAKDTVSGPAAYYRNQIEKLIQLGVFSKAPDGCFHPDREMTVHAFAQALCRLLKVDPADLASYPDGVLLRETMGAMLVDAYHARFDAKPRYMTDYNGKTKRPGDPGYDPNLDTGAQGAQYDPLVSYEQLTDTHELSPELASKVEDAYRLGLLRTEKGIARAQMLNGTELTPKQIVTRAKAAKALYFMWVLSQPVNLENDLAVIV